MWSKHKTSKNTSLNLHFIYTKCILCKHTHTPGSSHLATGDCKLSCYLHSWHIVAITKQCVNLSVMYCSVVNNRLVSWESDFFIFYFFLPVLTGLHLISLRLVWSASWSWSPVEAQSLCLSWMRLCRTTCWLHVPRPFPDQTGSWSSTS